MRGVNKVIIIGNLGADPETRQFSNGGSVTNISVATSEQWTDKQSGEKKEAVLAVTIPERTGAFLEFCRDLKGRNITEFNYRARSRTSPDSLEPASIFVGIALKEGDKERHIIADSLQTAGYNAHDLTDDDIAKSHIRYLIGGHADLVDEQLFKVSFPERPGALLNFLEKLGPDYNITLFHYRNHGAADGRVLVGIQATATSSRAVQDTLQEIGYDCTPVTDNIGYQLFLK